MGLKDVIAFVSVAFEAVGVAVIVGGFFYALKVSFDVRTGGGSAYESMRATFGRAVLLGLEVLVAGDIIRTVTVTPTLVSLAALGALVVIRTFLSWSLEVEIERHWPWQNDRS